MRRSLFLGGIFGSLLLGTVHSQHGDGPLMLDRSQALDKNVSHLFRCGNVADADQLVYMWC